MTVVHVDLTVPQRGTDERAPVAGTLDVSLFRRAAEGDHFVLVTAYAQVLVDGVADLELTPTDGTNAWVVKERVRDGRTRMVGVPQSSTAVNYVDLPDLDATTLAPFSGTASDQQASFRGAWQSGKAYPANSFVTNAGYLYFTDVPVPARATFNSADWKVTTSTAPVPPDATTTVKGVSRFATIAEVAAGSVATAAVTPVSLSATYVALRGAWVTGTAYPKNSLVIQGGAVYLAVADVPSRSTFTVGDWQALGGTPAPTPVTVTDNGDGTSSATGITVTDNGDGTFSSTGSVTDNGDGTFALAA